MQENDFWQNVSRYPRFLITISLGIFFSLFEKTKPVWQNPFALAALIGLLVGSFAFLYFTLKAMLGLNPV